MSEKQYMKPFFPFLILLIWATACSNNAETVRNPKSKEDGIYSEYQVWAEEGREDVTVRLQYRHGDREGTAFAMESPGKVLLDGEELTADSTQFTGVYYEVSKPVEDFKGKHTVVYVDGSGKKLREEFSFEPFTLAKEPPEKVKKDPFQIQLQGFPESPTLIRLVMVDTSLASADVNEELLVQNGNVDITEEFLANLTKGPVTLEIYREEERPVRGNAVNRGMFTMTYGLKREFTLIE